MKTNEVLKRLEDRELLDAIWQFSWRRCHTAHEAEDLCQDILLAVLSAVPKQERIENFHAFLWTIARRVWADHAEKRHRRREVLGIENLAELLPVHDETDRLAEEDADRTHLRRILSEIAFLSKAYRDVMVMYYIDELRVGEIARRLGIRETTVKQRLFSARNTIRKEVETVDNRQLNLKPVRLAFSGMGNPCGNDPRTKTERELSQNLIYLCRKRARSAKELAEELCVPMAYIEDELDIQCRGENGDYGTLRRLDNGRYISNILVVDYAEYDEANAIYERQLGRYCELLRQNFEKRKEDILSFPYFSEQTDAGFLLWSLISRTVWDFENKVTACIRETYFPETEPSRRPFTCVAVAYRDELQPRFGFWGCDGNAASAVGGYKKVLISNIYGEHIDKHFACGYNITADNELLMTIRSLENGLCVTKLDEEEKEIAAKAIACGYLRKQGERLLPRIVAFEQSRTEAFYALSYALNEGTQSLADTVAEELSAFMKRHIPPHLIGEAMVYPQLIAGVRLLHGTINECLRNGLLSPPPQRCGAEGVILIVEK